MVSDAISIQIRGGVIRIIIPSHIYTNIIKLIVSITINYYFIPIARMNDFQSRIGIEFI